ncbi:uncharacterized protein LOC117218563 [Megalopta genalis]|uniref:uncharacterized protein LOC117218563 n=1 Tax=Megalopta genalis TaxID=115081 RepID=UPI003FD66395
MDRERQSTATGSWIDPRSDVVAGPTASDNMSRSYGRRARSLDDVAVETFGKFDRRDGESSEASFAYRSCQQFLATGKKIESSESAAGGEGDGAGVALLEKSDPKRLAANPVDSSRFVDPAREENEDADRSADDWKEKFKNNKRLLSWIDAVFSLLLVAPMAVGFWRGIWTLMDLYVRWFPRVATFVFGILTHTIFAIFKNRLHDRACAARASRRKSRVRKTFLKILQIFYTYVFGVACNAQWRGGWYIYDYYFSDRVW